MFKFLKEFVARGKGEKARETRIIEHGFSQIVTDWRG
jgi:hypothetical protein